MKPTAAIPMISNDVAEPPAEVPVVEQESGRKRSREPDDADGDEQVGAALREAERAQRAPEEHRVERQPGHEDDPRCGAPRFRDGRHEAGLDDRRDAEPEDEHDACREQPEQRLHGGRPPKRGERAERENRTADRKRRAAGERRDADLVDEHATASRARAGRAARPSPRTHTPTRTA